MRTLRPTSAAGIALRSAIVGLTLATGWIHLTLGGLLFTANGAGFVFAAIAMILPIPLALRFRWLVRLGLIAYALAAIVGWYLTGPRYDVAYVAKAIEIALIALLAIEVWAYDGNPIARIGRTARQLRRA